MKKTNGHDEGHFYKYTLLTPFDGEGCDQLNLLLRKLLRNSFSTFVKLLTQLNEMNLPYYLCGGTGALKALHALQLNKVLFGGPYLACSRCHRITYDGIMEHLCGETVRCKKCGAVCEIDGFAPDDVYFWHPGRSDVHFEICVSEEGFNWIRGSICSLAVPMIFSPSDIVITESPAEQKLVYGRITVRCDGTVPNRRYRTAQRPVPHWKLMDFIKKDLCSSASILAPDYAELIHSEYMRGIGTDAPLALIGMQRGKWSSAACGLTLPQFLRSKCSNSPFTVTPEKLRIDALFAGASEREAIEYMEAVISLPSPAERESTTQVFTSAWASALPAYHAEWLACFYGMKSYSENVDFAAMHYLLSK